MQIDLEQAHDLAFNISRKVGVMLDENLANPPEIEMKGYKDFVTVLDRKSEDIIREELGKFDDSIAFFGEESTPASDIGQDGDKQLIDVPDTCWIVDPIDGTSNYAHGFAVYGVSIALRVEGELKVGVIDQPSLGKTFSAIAGQGAHVYQDGKSSPLSTKDRGEGLNLVALSIPFWQPDYLDSTWENIKRMFTIFQDIRRAGAATCDQVWTADGTYGGYAARFLKPWDIAAGGLIIREAGGSVTDWDGDADTWLESGRILAAASAELHEKMLSLIK